MVRQNKFLVKGIKQLDYLVIARYNIGKKKF